MSAVTGGQAQRAAPAVVKPPLGVPRRLLRMRSDAALAERFAAGDELAFDVIYERHRSVVLAVSMGVLGTSQDAEDATQETFSALAVALRSKPPVELRPWLIRVARNASIDTTRRRRHRLLTLDGEIPDVPARHQAAGQAELAVVLDGIRELPEGQRMALLMRELGGHTYLEIAEFLETDEEAVKGLIARARVGLRTYREATELPCTTARSAIAAEPDGRRYDKTIRRHLRSCASCRAYRSALRDDAKVLRAALPLQTGTVATGGISTGMLTAAKGTLVGYGITQAATTCAASACAVGAIGGMVLVTPVHKLGLPLIGQPRSAPAPAHIARPVDRHRVVLRHTAVASSGAAAQPVKKAGKVAATGHAIKLSHARTGAAAGTIHRHRRITVTKVKLPNLPAAAATGTAQASASAPTAGAGAPVTQSSTPAVTTTPSQTPATASATTIGSGTQSTANQGTQGTGSAGYGASWASGDPTGSTSSQSQSGNGTFNGNPTTSVVRAGGWQSGYGGGTTTTSTVTSPDTTTTSTVTSPDTTTTSTVTSPDTTTTSIVISSTDTTTTDTTASDTVTSANTSPSTTTTSTPAISPAVAASAQTTTAPSQWLHDNRGGRWGAHQRTQ